MKSAFRYIDTATGVNRANSLVQCYPGFAFDYKPVFIAMVVPKVVGL